MLLLAIIMTRDFYGTPAGGSTLISIELWTHMSFYSGITTPELIQHTSRPFISGMAPRDFYGTPANGLALYTDGDGVIVVASDNTKTGAPIKKKKLKSSPVAHCVSTHPNSSLVATCLFVTETT